MLSFLLDANLPPAIADVAHTLRPEISITYLAEFRDGTLHKAPDDEIILAANKAELTLVSRDTKTIPSILRAFYEAGIPFSGVVFVHRITFPHDNPGVIAKALIKLWDKTKNEGWISRVEFLEK